MYRYSVNITNIYSKHLRFEKRMCTGTVGTGTSEKVALNGMLL